MSRGFVKEEDQEELPVIPPRAALPTGATNYVTPFGHTALLREKEALEEERKRLPQRSEAEYRRAAMVIDARLKSLNQRIASARIIALQDQPRDEVRFGAVVQFDNGDKIHKFQIVGVDEADVKQKKIAFTAPIARALVGKKVNETIAFQRGRTVQKLKIISITYEEDAPNAATNGYGSNKQPSP